MPKTKDLNTLKYKIQEAGSGFIGHWFYLMLPALRKIRDNKKCYICLDDKNLTDYQKQTFELLSYKYEYTENDSNFKLLQSIKPISSSAWDKYNIFKIFKKNFFIHKKNFFFLRKLFEKSLNENYTTNIKKFPKKIFIKRSGSHLLKGNASDARIKNIKRRQIINEDELEKFLEKNGFFIVDTKNFHIGDKLLFFKNAEIVLGANGGGLTYTFFSGNQTKICEIVAKNPHQFIDHYKDQCVALGIEFYRFDDVKKIDEFDNIIVDIKLIKEYLKFNNLL